MLLFPRRLARLTLRSVRAEHGFTLIEAVMAMAIFLGVSTALAGVLTSSISARSLASERTAAEQVANDQLEWIRSLDYADVGLTANGNPAGDVNATGNQSARRPDGSVALHRGDRDHVGGRPRPDELLDQGELQERDRHRVPYPRRQGADGAEHPGRAPSAGGIRRHQPRDRQRPGARLLLRTRRSRTPSSISTTGPAPPLSDSSDAAGYVRFPALSPASGSTYYDLVVPTFNGYILLPDPATHFQLAAGSTPPTKVLQVYRPVTLTVAFNQTAARPSSARSSSRSRTPADRRATPTPARR